MGSGTLTHGSGSGSYVQMGLLGLVAILAITLGAKADDLPFAIHMFIFAAAAILAVIMIARNAHKPAASQAEYLDSVVRAGAIATVFWGVVGFLVGLVVALQLAYPAWNPNLEWFNFGRLRPAAHLGGDLRLRRQRPALHQLLRRPAHLPRPPGARQSRLVRLLGLPALHRAGRHRLSPRRHRGPRICRTRMVRRHLDHGGLGRLFPGLLRHPAEAQGTPHLRGQLVLPRLHRDHRDAAHRQQPVDAGLVHRATRATRCSRACRTR